MESVARRMLKLTNGDSIAPFPPEARMRAGQDLWSGQVDWPEPLLDIISAAPVTFPAAPSHGGETAAGAGMDEPASISGPVARGKRVSLCIGIDKYKGSPLSGRVADANLWADTLRRLGYDVETMLDEQATSGAVLERIARLVANTSQGDDLVIQFSGHGTQFEDLDNDEAEGDTPAKDECLCAFDVSNDLTGGLVIDDELRAIFDTAAEGARITCFFDSCHSGSATRAALRADRSLRARGQSDRKARYLHPTELMRQAYARQICELRSTRTRAVTVQKDVQFSACRSSELAYEEGGQGDFTRHATRVLTSSAKLSNSGFLDRVLQEFGRVLRQNPELHCAPAARRAAFLGL